MCELEPAVCAVAVESARRIVVLDGRECRECGLRIRLLDRRGTPVSSSGCRIRGRRGFGDRPAWYGFRAGTRLRVGEVPTGAQRPQEIISPKGLGIAAPFNSIGFQMNPSREECEAALRTLAGANIVAFSSWRGDASRRTGNRAYSQPSEHYCHRGWSV